MCRIPTPLSQENLNADGLLVLTGNEGIPAELKGMLYANGGNGEDTHRTAYSERYGTAGYWLQGGYGGGAAYGNAGAAGSSGWGSIYDDQAIASPASGGRGGNAKAPQKAIGYGRGGTSGNGGGGGGAAGSGLKGSGDPSEYLSATTWLENRGSSNQTRVSLTMYAPASAPGGAGSGGGEGADGAIILFRGG